MKKGTVILFFALLHLGLFAQIPTDNLLLHMPFNGNANDETGNGNSGVVYGPSLTTDRFGNPNSAYSFDGIDDYIDINNSNLDASLEATINFWFAASSSWNSSTDHQALILSDVLGDNNGDFLIAFNRTNCGGSPASNDGKFHFELQGDMANGNSVNCPTYGLTKVSSNVNTWNSQEWNMITAIVNGGRIKIYVNGVFQNIQDCSSALFINGQNVTLGRYFAPQQLSVFDGSMDDIRIYGRALTDIEITSIFNELNPLSTTSIDPVVSVQVYPNPASNSLTIEIDDNTVDNKIKFRNILGQVTHEVTLVASKSNIDLANFVEKGIYFIEIYNNKNQLIGVKKIILE